MYLMDDQQAGLILLFNGDSVSKEMLVTEFEAILGGLAPDVCLAGREYRACFVLVNSKLHAETAVFFRVAFDAKGWVDSGWNLPIHDLARSSARGPDMGSGPVHVASQSTCPIQLFHDMLWEPSSYELDGHFKEIQRVVARNRLELIFGTTEQNITVGDAAGYAELEARITQKLSKQHEQDLKTYIAKLVTMQNLQTASVSDEKDDEIKALKIEHNKRLERLKRELDDTQKSLARATETNHRLEDSARQQQEKLEHLREYFQLKLENARSTDSDTLNSLKQHYEMEMDARLSGLEAEHREVLHLKEIELRFRVEHEQKLQAEIEILREQNQQLVSGSGDKLLNNLSLKGVNFVTYQPGAGHITIPIAEIPTFIEGPIAFTASYCNVSEKHYHAWLTHYHAPVCDAEMDSGERCCDDVTRVNKPIDFVVGESNYCDTHRHPGRPKLVKIHKAS